MEIKSKGVIKAPFISVSHKRNMPVSLGKSVYFQVPCLLPPFQHFITLKPDTRMGYSVHLVGVEAETVYAVISGNPDVSTVSY